MAGDEKGFTFRAPVPNRVKFNVLSKAEGKPPFRAAPHLTQFRTFEREDEGGQGPEPDVFWPVNNSLWDRTRELEAEVTSLRSQIAQLQERLAATKPTLAEPTPASPLEPGGAPQPAQVSEATPAEPLPKKVPRTKSTPVYVRVIDLD